MMSFFPAAFGLGFFLHLPQFYLNKKAKNQLHKLKMVSISSFSQERALAASFADFVEYGLLLLQNHRVLFPADNELACEKLEYLLR